MWRHTPRALPRRGGRPSGGDPRPGYQTATCEILAPSGRVRAASSPPASKHLRESPPCPFPLVLVLRAMNLVKNRSKTTSENVKTGTGSNSSWPAGGLPADAPPRAAPSGRRAASSYAVRSLPRTPGSRRPPRVVRRSPPRDDLSTPAQATDHEVEPPAHPRSSCGDHRRRRHGLQQVQDQEEVHEEEQVQVREARVRGEEQPFTSRCTKMYPA